MLQWYNNITWNYDILLYMLHHYNKIICNYDK